jgi:DNA-binding CsgD family transcriptional regulator
MTLQEKLDLFDPQSLKTMGLTQRETEVLAWVAEGKSNNDVGLILGIRSVTVKKHLEHIFEKMGVETRTAAVVFALKASRQMVKATFLPFGYLLTGKADNIPSDLTVMLQILLFN